MNTFMIYIPTRVLFGVGMLNNLHQQKAIGKKAMITVSSGESMKANGYLKRVEEQLTKAGAAYSIFDEIESNPTKDTIMRGAAAARKSGCDFIVALGGGSVMDASKAIAAMATNDGDIWDYVSGGTGKGKPINISPLPIIAITTTAGTGSEVDAWGVISNPDTNEKIGFGGDDRLFPVLSIVDPALMITVPPIFTAYQGFDAFLQAVECYVSKFANLMSDMYALTVIEAIGKYLARAVKNGDDIEAREKVAFANTISGMTMAASCTTSEHSLEHAMSAYHSNLPHGAGLIMISKAYFSHLIEKHICDDRFIVMAKTLGIEKADSPQAFITALSQLQEDCGVANLKMSDYGFSKKEFKQLAECAKETMPGLFAADRIDITVSDCINIFENSYE